jgi:hypothetical protein
LVGCGLYGDGKCTDPEEFVDEETGEDVCRRRPGAILKAQLVKARLREAAQDMYEALKAGKSGAILNGPELLERVAEIINHQYTKLAAALRHKADMERAALAKAEGRPADG